MPTQTKVQDEIATPYPAQQASAYNLQIPASEQLFSTSADEETAALVTPENPGFGNSMMGEGLGNGGGQYGWGGQSWRPTYRGANSNEDGSLKFILYGGMGATVPMSSTSHDLIPSFSIQGGLGPRFGRHFALPVEFDWDEFGFTKTTLDNQIAIYDSVFGNDSVKNLLNGNSHIWSFSLQPTFTFHAGDIWTAYATLGGGFYHKVANFTLPDGPCYFYCATFNLDHYTSNAPGADAGLGMTFGRLYLEARYVYIDNKPRTGIVNTPASLATITNTTTDFYPANSNRTQYVPVTVGFRW
ncbi:MAG: hypothetical protein ACP5E5_04285 [Acidobacteriaceae bacterium]